MQHIWAAPSNTMGRVFILLIILKNPFVHFEEPFFWFTIFSIFGFHYLSFILFFGFVLCTSTVPMLVESNVYAGWQELDTQNRKGLMADGCQKGRYEKPRTIYNII